MERVALSFVKLLSFLLLFLSYQSLATETDFRLHIHVHHQQQSDTWKVQYVLPIAVDHIAFQRQSNFDRSKLYHLDESKFKWEKAGDVLLIRSIDGSKFESLDLTFSSYYDDIQKDYTHNLRYSDGSVLLYTNHIALGANIIEDKAISPIGSSFRGTQFHFYSPKQNIIFLGNVYSEKAQWDLQGEGTYVYFGNLSPIETDNMIAIVDPILPKWAWDNTQQYFPKLFDYYEKKTGQPLNFKPVVFFNYDQVDGDYSNYSGGTLAGLVQLTINGKRWQTKNEEQFNMLFHFLAHEAAHFWNGQMFAFEDQKHAWMHEGGADTFANFAMLEFDLIDSKQMMQKFEDSTNSCLLNKGKESLAQSAELRLYRNYYTCGATMALASHFAIKAKSPNKSVFDLWKRLFNANMKNRTYTQQDYFNELSQLTGSDLLSKALGKFSSQTNIDNQSEISSWFEQTEITTKSSFDYPSSIKRHWGKQVIYNLMEMHCDSVSFSSYDDYVKTYPMDKCKTFQHSAEIQYVAGLDIFRQGIDAYNLFREKCQQKGTVSLQNREKVNIVEIECLREVAKVESYLRFE
ncbi:MAG: hypothetical protein HRT53_13090 [Colwellia sp.]|nr:hypothetical protein [Colwellia sp.]